MNELDTGTLIKISTIILMFLSKVICDQYLDVYQTPGKWGHYLRMTKNPGKNDFEELSVCLRYTVQDKRIFQC